MASKPKAHGLARGEKIVARNGDIVVTSDGRKVRLDADGKVLERLVGPAYSWEASEAPEPETDEDKPVEE